MEAVTPIPKIRSGNEFTLVWSITRAGIDEDLTAIEITDMNLTVCVGGLCAERVDVPFTIVDGNKVRSQHLHELTGTYNLELTYKKSGIDTRVDVDAFRIVATSADASDSTEFSITSDIAIGFKGEKGDKGDPFIYTDFTQEQLDDLMKPANDKVADIELLESQISSAEAIREDNETDRQTAEGLRISAETSRQTAEGLRQTNTATAISNANTATGLANIATSNANIATGLANTATTNANNAATNANEKATLANTAATNADNARLAIQTDLGLKLDKTAVKQITGTSTTDVMSQKAVTDELVKKHQVVANYTHTGNKEVNIESIDFATGTITATGHGLAVNSPLYPINKGMGNFPFSAIPNGLNPFTRYVVVNVTTNTFQLSLTSGGVPITLSDKATKDYSKWHFESIGSATISGLSLRKFTVEIEGKSNGIQAITDYFYLYGGKNYGDAGAVWFTDTEYRKITSGLGSSIFRSIANGDIWSYNKLEIDVTGKLASILINGYRIYSLTETTSGIIRHDNEVAVHSSAGEDVVTSFTQIGFFNGMNIKVTKIL